MIVFVLSIPAWAAGTRPVVGGQLPDMKLATPKKPEDQGYLGIAPESRSFRIPQIKAQVVIIEIFSMYCPHCQKEAPVVNELYAAIEKNPALKGKTKLIGIGVGNSLYEVGVFRKKYKVPFPLFADADSVIHNQVGEVGTPYFIGVKINPDGSHRIFYARLGALEGVDQFLESVLEISGLQ